MNWILLSIIALSCFSVMVTLITMLSRGGLPVSFILFGLSIVITIYYFIQTFLTTHFKFTVDSRTVIFLLVIGLLSGFGNWAQFQAANDAPNPLLLTYGVVRNNSGNSVLARITANSSVIHSLMTTKV